MTILRNKLMPFCLLAMLLAPSLAQAYISSENFDTNWLPYLPLTNSAPTIPGTNPVTGWISSSTRILSNFGSQSSPYAAAPDQFGWVQSPTLSNGVGTVYFYLRGPASGSSTGVVETSTDDVIWRTNGNPHVISGTAWIGQTNVVNTNVSVKVRLRRISSVSPWAVDSVSISAPPPIVSISNLLTAPLSPADLDPVSITAGVGIQGIYDSLGVTNYWREWPGTNWTTTPMATNAAGDFAATSTIPGKVIGSLIEYYVSASCTQDGIPYSTNSTLRSYVVRPQSGFTNMLLIGQINTNLLISDNYSWQNMVSLSNSVNPTFRFQGASNAVVTVWGDSNQAASNVPAYGTADINATNIILAGANTGTFVIGFNESNRAYTVMACDAITFDTWTSSTFNAFGNYTNDTWIVSGGSTSNDAARAFSGRSLVLNGQQGAATNTYLLSPPLTNGIGKISFWYRNWSTNASPTATFSVQAAASPASSNWNTIATVTNIISTNYLFFTVGRSDRDNQYVRILNNPNGGNSRLCLDDIVIARPGAGVVAISITNTPANPTILDTVDINALLSPQSGAIITNMILWYRMGTDGMFESTTMSSTNGTFWTSDTAIPRAATGTVQYAMFCSFSGFQSESSSPVWLPSAGTNGPASYQVTTPFDNRRENFDSNWSPTNLPWSIYQNGTNTLTGWTVKDGRITGGFSPYSSPYACALSTNGNGWIQSPFLSNGVGSINFFAKRGATVDTNPVLVQISYDSTNFTLATNFVTSTSFQPFYFPLNLTSNLFVRIRRDTANQSPMSFDDFLLPFPPADVLITNVFINPGYPSASDTVTVSCNISSSNPFFPAWGITPTLYYRKSTDASFTPLTMSRLSGTTYSTAPFTIPMQLRGTIIYYYIRCDFKGYYGAPGDNHSPRFYPPGSSNAPSNYLVSQFDSSFSNVTAIVNGQTQTTARLLSDRSWQTVARLATSTNTLSVSFIGAGYGIGAGYSTNPVTWGNSNNWQTALPLSDVAGTDQTAFAISGSFNAGQYLIRFDEASGQYLVIPCVWQDFETKSGIGTPYTLLDISTTSRPPVTVTFDSWTTDTARVRTDSFNSTDWTAMTSYTNGGVGGDDFYVIYGAKIFNQQVQLNPFAIQRDRWVAQIVDESPVPFRGIESITYSYKALTNAPPYTNNTIGIYFFPTNYPHNPDYSDLTALPLWKLLTNHFGVVNMSPATNTITLQTNQAYNVIFSHDVGTNTVFFDDITIKEWYSRTVTNDNWIATYAWIERKTGSIVDNICRLEASRADPMGAEQYLLSPLITNGIDTLTINYSAGANSNVSFDVQIAFDTPTTWSNIASVSTSITSPGSTYSNAFYSLLLPPSNTYIRIRNTTPKPGALLLDTITIAAYVQRADWRANNGAIDSTAALPPAGRQFYGSACYLNSNRTSGVASPLPLTNVYPYVRTPQIFTGIGEVSFWYRNWALTGPVPPARILVQTCATDSTNIPDWSTIGVINNVVNTNDYLYFCTTVYDPVSQYVRIINDDQTLTNAGRVCLDDILVTAPMASTLVMSNLVVSPVIPLYSNTVDVLVDVYNLFLSPSNINLTAFYGSATNYAGLATATVSNLPMSCIASNLTTPGKWYRYKTTTPIPTNAIDTFVKYFVSAMFSGYHTEMTSPSTNRSFGIYPSWYDPMNAVNGTNQAYYVVYSCPTGSVWFNEINYVDDSWSTWTNEYVEICGLTSNSIKDWTIEIMTDYGAGATVSVYRITNSFVLPNDTNGHGFWVLGDVGVPNVDMVFTGQYAGFTDSLNANQNLPIAGGLVLRRKTGSYEDRVTYGTLAAPWPGFTHAGNADAFSGELGMIGSGANKADFAWSGSELTNRTPGAANPGQTLLGGVSIQNEPPTIIIFSFRVNTNVWITCNTTNNWFPVPWYTTNLISTNSWTNVAVFTRNIVTTNCTLNFDKPTNGTPFFYRVNATNGP